MTLSSTILTSVENSSRPRLMPLNMVCKLIKPNKAQCNTKYNMMQNIIQKKSVIQGTGL
jgi:hypothetical protein